MFGEDVNNAVEKLQ